MRASPAHISPEFKNSSLDNIAQIRLKRRKIRHGRERRWAGRTIGLKQLLSLALKPGQFDTPSFDHPMLLPYMYQSKVQEVDMGWNEKIYVEKVGRLPMGAENKREELTNRRDDQAQSSSDTSGESCCLVLKGWLIYRAAEIACSRAKH